MANLHYYRCYSSWIKYLSTALILFISPLHAIRIVDLKYSSEILCEYLASQKKEDFMKELEPLRFEICFSKDPIQTAVQFYLEFLQDLGRKTGKTISTQAVLEVLEQMKDQYDIPDNLSAEVAQFLNYANEVSENPTCIGLKKYGSLFEGFGIGGGPGNPNSPPKGQNLFSILEIGAGIAIGITFGWSGAGGVVAGSLIAHGMGELIDKAHNQWQTNIYGGPPGATVNKPYQE